MRNSEIAKFGTLQKRQTQLKVYADWRGPRTFEKLVEEKIQSHIKQFTRKLKGDKKMKHRRREPGSRVLSSQANTSRAMQGRIPKIPNFPLFKTNDKKNLRSQLADWHFRHSQLYRSLCSKFYQQPPLRKAKEHKTGIIVILHTTVSTFHFRTQL